MTNIVEEFRREREAFDQLSDSEKLRIREDQLEAQSKRSYAEWKQKSDALQVMTYISFVCGGLLLWTAFNHFSARETFIDVDGTVVHRFYTWWGYSVKQEDVLELRWNDSQETTEWVVLSENQKPTTALLKHKKRPDWAAQR